LRSIQARDPQGGTGHLSLAQRAGEGGALCIDREQGQVEIVAADDK
jgi:hypothetical protein